MELRNQVDPQGAVPHTRPDQEEVGRTRLDQEGVGRTRPDQEGVGHIRPDQEGVGRIQPDPREVDHIRVVRGEGVGRIQVEGPHIQVDRNRRVDLQETELRNRADRTRVVHRIAEGAGRGNHRQGALIGNTHHLKRFNMKI